MSLSIFLFLVIIVLPNKNIHKRNDKESDKKETKDIIETDFDKRLTEKGEKETEKQSYESSQRHSSFYFFQWMRVWFTDDKYLHMQL